MSPRSPCFRYQDFTVTVYAGKQGESDVLVEVEVSNRKAEEAAREVAGLHPGRGEVVAVNRQNPYNRFTLTRSRVPRG